MIKLIDAMGNREYVRQYGRMGIMRHSEVLSALEKRTLRYRRKDQRQVDVDKVLFNEAIDETGTVSTACLTDSDNESLGNRTIEAEVTYLEQEEM